MQTLRRLWRDEQGAVLSAELVLIAVITVIGLVVGLAAFRDSVVGELGDTAAAVGELNQSYVNTIQANGVGDPEQAVQITLAGAANNETVTLRREFQIDDPNSNNPADTIDGVVVVATFRNFDYVDNTEQGDGDDASTTQPPAGIVIGGVGAPASAGEATSPATIP